MGPNGLPNAAKIPKLDCQKAAEGKLFHCRWDLSTIAVDLKVIWGMSVTMGLEDDDSEGRHLEIRRFSVSPRYPKPRIRRTLNFPAVFREPVFDLQSYQDDTTPWALEQIPMMAR